MEPINRKGHALPMREFSEVLKQVVDRRRDMAIMLDKGHSVEEVRSQCVRGIRPDLIEEQLQTLIDPDCDRPLFRQFHRDQVDVRPQNQQDFNGNPVG